MKIRRLTPILAHAGRRVLIFIKVETDEPDLVGWGEASLEGKPQAVAGCIHDLEPLLRGEDPCRIEHCWQLMYRGGFWRLGVIGLSALSGIDQALWDIKGKAAGKSVYDLLGGRVRDRVRAYTHFGGATPEAMVENALEKVAAGWTAIKTVPVPVSAPVDSPAKVKKAAAALAAVRDAVGDEVDILLDMHGRLTPQMAIQYGRAFEPYHPFFIEEPCQAENPAAMVRVSQALSTPIATGERLFTRWGFREVLEQGAASLLQPDTCHAGGISEVRKIATMAEVYYAGLAPHNPYGPVSTAACVQVDAVCPNFVIQEMVDPRGWPAQQFVEEPLVLKDGYLQLPDKPGIGVEVDEDACAAAHPDDTAARKHMYRRYLAFHEDGSLLDS